MKTKINIVLLVVSLAVVLVSPYLRDIFLSFGILAVLGMGAEYLFVRYSSGEESGLD
ncbi:hypothetical protein [Paenibacillus chitinolyticus]|uniref:Phosphatidate cytidylyltransferase n=1 Tax=Paenibacillus chitinolyticus TaxID=79263 RepID=A0ABT4FHD6_9BACL|nr:hypothetical protein [Paenibacillus chitinolyticus]MCY9588557.1 hypothetical protein [Paenibacillus chitinolyticus]MCY9597927.1 hypothetical protein [Paenibacillus chitinolyticus]GKS12566.1 hypothetical protein YDYSY3_35660 [Paenibacillus chitinolyticus]